jgi:hypothetical protein
LLRDFIIKEDFKDSPFKGYIPRGLPLVLKRELKLGK